MSVNAHECGSVLGMFPDTNFNTSLHCSSCFVKLVLKYMLQMGFSNLFQLLFILDILFLLNTFTREDLLVDIIIYISGGGGLQQLVPHNMYLPTFLNTF